MALDYEVPQDKRLLYWLGDKLIDYRHPVSIVVLVVTALFAYWAFQLQLVTSFGDLLPQNHAVREDPQQVLRDLRRRQQHHRDDRGRGRHIFTEETLNKI